MTHRFLGTFLLTGLALNVSVCLSQPDVVEIKREQVPQYRKLDGTVEAIHESTVSSRISGVVSKIHFDVNDYVQAGTVILETDSSAQQAAMKKAEGAMMEARTRLEESRLQFERAQKLYANKTVSQASYEQAQAAFDAAKARLQSAQAAYSEARLQLDYTRVKAPYSGIVKTRHLQVGEKVGPGTPLMTGLSLEKLRVVFDVSQRDVVWVRQAEAMQIETSDGSLFKGGRAVVFPYADPQTRTFQVRLSLSERIEGLFPGMLVKVLVPTGASDSFWIPVTALVQRSELKAVYLLDDADKVRLRAVIPGAEKDGRLEILAGLKSGDRLVLKPLDALKTITEGD